MRASDFILQTRADLQEKSEHWGEEELLIKLRRAYVSLQYDLPYFIKSETLSIVEGTDEYYLEFEALKNIKLTVDKIEYSYSTLENFYTHSRDKQYTLNRNMLLISNKPTKAMSATLVYKYFKEINTLNCYVELPVWYENALRLLFLSYIHEKPTRNSKERNLSLHYIKLYNIELQKLKVEQKMRTKNITSNYQKV